jgi:hypothetical protein
MNKASEALLALKPVTFRYKKEIEPNGATQFGLIAEEVEKVNPDLVGRNKKGEVETVRYEAVNAMLLNEFLREHRKMEEQQKQIDALTAQLKQQAVLIQKVSDKAEVNWSTRQVVANESVRPHDARQTLSAFVSLRHARAGKNEPPNTPKGPQKFRGERRSSRKSLAYLAVHLLKAVHRGQGMLPAGSPGSPWDDSVRLADKMDVPGLLSPIAISFLALKRWDIFRKCAAYFTQLPIALQRCC